MHINTKYIVWSGILIALLAIGVFVYTDKVLAPTHPVSQTVSATAEAAPQTAHITLTIDGLYTAKQVSVTSGQTVLDVLQMLAAADQRIKLVSKEYAGLGTLVVGLNGITNGTGKKYWQYKVNGVMPQIGAGQLPVKDGESVDWFFGSSQQ